MSGARIVTFYSFKGGVGRTMALANLAVLLASRGLRVLAMDFDLEAPGLGRYLLADKTRLLTPTASMTTPGVVELFAELQAGFDAHFADDDRYAADPAFTLATMRAIIHETLDRRAHLCTVTASTPAAKERFALDYMPAGQLDATYNARREALDWRRFHLRYAEAFPLLAEALRARWDVVLIDSRTGLSDTASVCTALLPDTLVVVCVPNLQSLDGAVDVARQAAALRVAHVTGPDAALLQGVDVSAYGTGLRVLPLVSRVENAEYERKRTWMARIHHDFAQLASARGVLLPAELDRYLMEVRVPYVTHYAYGEELAVERESIAEADGLARVFALLAQHLEAGTWEAAGLPPRVVDASTDVLALVSIGAPSIEASVRASAKDLGLEGVPIALNYSVAGFVPPEEDHWLRHARVLRGLVQPLLDRPALRRIHLFYRGPVVMAPLLGALIASARVLEIYYYEGGRYLHAFPLDRRFVHETETTG